MKHFTRNISCVLMISYITQNNNVNDWGDYAAANDNDVMM